MSDISHPHPAVRFRVRSRRFLLLIATLLAVTAAILVVAFSSGSSESRSVAPISNSSGPNETARGNAAATASGASQPAPVGGPNESARGNAAASASRR